MRISNSLSLAALTLVAGLSGVYAAETSVTLGLQLEPPHLDPTSAAAGAIDQVLYSNVYEGLTRFASDGTIIPGLAESWDVSDDGLTYTFNLHDGVTFHDGSSFEASDVVFSLDRARAEDSVNAQKALFEGIVSVEAVNDLTVTITLANRNGTFLFNLAWGDAVIIAPEQVDNLQSEPVGTGAFKFSNWAQGDSIDLVRNPDYWGTPAALEEVTFKFISDPSAAFASVMAQDIDGFYNYPAPENLLSFEADPRFAVLSGSTEGETILAMNNKLPPFDNPLVRQAVSLAIDRNAIIDGAMFGYGTPIGSHFAPHHPDYIDLTDNSAFDVEGAKALMAEAGFADGFTTSLKLPPPSYARRGGEIIAAQLREIGIETEISNLEWAQWLEEAFRGYDFGLTIVSHTEPLDIGIYARPDYYFQYDNPEFQQLIADLTIENDPAKRSEMLKTAQRIISDDYVNAYLFQLANVSVVDKKIEGIWENAPTQAVDMTAVHWVE